MSHLGRLSKWTISLTKHKEDPKRSFHETPFVCLRQQLGTFGFWVGESTYTTISHATASQTHPTSISNNKNDQYIKTDRNAFGNTKCVTSYPARCCRHGTARCSDHHRHRDLYTYYVRHGRGHNRAICQHNLQLQFSSLERVGSTGYPSHQRSAGGASQSIQHLSNTCYHRPDPTKLCHSDTCPVRNVHAVRLDSHDDVHSIFSAHLKLELHFDQLLSHSPRSGSHVDSAAIELNKRLPHSTWSSSYVDSAAIRLRVKHEREQ